MTSTGWTLGWTTPWVLFFFIIFFMFFNVLRIPSVQTVLAYLTRDHKNNSNHEVQTLTNQICSLTSSCLSLALFYLFSLCIMHGLLTPKQPWRNAAKRGGVSGRDTQRDAKPRRNSRRVREKSNPDILFRTKWRTVWPRVIPFLLFSLCCNYSSFTIPLEHTYNLQPCFDPELEFCLCLYMRYP